MTTPRLTIVIPAHNREQVLQRTLDSVAAQELRPLSVLLVDNGSSDSTLTVMRKWAASDHGLDVRVLQESKPGAAAARNRGLSEVRTEWTMFFDSDDTMRYDHCKRALEAADGVDLVGWNVLMHFDDGNSAVKKFYCSDVQYHSLFHGSTATLRYMARTDLFRRAGGWNDSVRYWDDIELGARLLELNPRMRHAGKELTVDVFASAHSITGTRYSDRVDVASMALKHIGRTLGPDRAAYIGLKTAILAGDCRREGAVVAARELMESVSRTTPSRFMRMLLRAAYLYQASGGRATARILRTFMP